MISQHPYICTRFLTCILTRTYAPTHSDSYTHTHRHTDLSRACIRTCPLVWQYVILASQGFLSAPGSANTLHSEPLETQLSWVQSRGLGCHPKGLRSNWTTFRDSHSEDHSTVCRGQASKTPMTPPAGLVLLPLKDGWELGLLLTYRIYHGCWDITFVILCRHCIQILITSQVETFRFLAMDMQGSVRG